jgi:hypothetical protein
MPDSYPFFRFITESNYMLTALLISSKHCEIIAFLVEGHNQLSKIILILTYIAIIHGPYD